MYIDLNHNSMYVYLYLFLDIDIYLYVIQIHLYQLGIFWFNCTHQVCLPILGEEKTMSAL